MTTSFDDGDEQPGPADGGVTHQTEDERIRALEFMLATRAQQEGRARTAHAIEEVADHPDADPRAQFEEALHEHPGLPSDDESPV